MATVKDHNEQEDKIGTLIGLAMSSPADAITLYPSSRAEPLRSIISSGMRHVDSNIARVASAILASPSRGTIQSYLHFV